jgi:DNA-binding transcriptional LysR family regulator
MTLKQLEAFYWAAALGSFSQAATRLNISQSSLSKRIAELEQQLGRELFDRSGHRCQRTPQGDTLMPLARQMLQYADEVYEVMAEDATPRGVCRFGVGELAALSWLPRFVAHVREAYPDLALEPHVDLGRALEARVESGELDFAVVAGTSMRAALVSHPVDRVRFLWAGAPSLVGKRRIVTADMLAHTAIITMPSDAGSTREFDHWLATNHLQVGRRLQCNNLGAIAGMVAAGIGISFLPEGWIKELVRRREVVLMESRPALPTLVYSFQYRRDDIRPLIDKLKSSVKETVDFSISNRLLPRDQRAR